MIADGPALYIFFPETGKPLLRCWSRRGYIVPIYVVDGSGVRGWMVRFVPGRRWGFSTASFGCTINTMKQYLS